jgi:hypothetical protein
MEAAVVMGKATQSAFSRRLPYPLYVKGGGSLVTVDDARRHMLALPERIALQKHWQHAAELMLDRSTELSAIGRQLHLALLLDAALDTTKTEIPER